MKSRAISSSHHRLFLGILAFTGISSGAMAQFPPPMRTATAGLRATATVVSVEALHEQVVVGKHCAPMLRSAANHIACMPVTSLKPTAVGYVAEFAGIRFSGITYRPLAVGNDIEVDVAILINPAE